jgi:hypothetical protein
LLLSADGARSSLICQVTGLSRDAITDIRRRWQERRMPLLRQLPLPARPPKVTAEYRKQLRKPISPAPLAYGYIFTVCSIARLNTHLQKTTAIKICNDRLRQLLLAEALFYRRPKHTLKGKRNEHAFRNARKKLDGLKKGL